MNPFTLEKSESIATLGEVELIRRIREWLGNASPKFPYGIGDDCSVLPPTSSHATPLVTADPVIYGKHFDDAISPEQAATKLTRRNLSDIAAMGGIPKHAIICLALSHDVSISWIKRFHRCLARESERFDFKIVGGDVSSADNFCGAFLTLYGETEPQTAPLLRAQAKVRSPVFVTGSLGGSRIQKHHSFIPRIAEGVWLAKYKGCLSCTDLSDGLGKDFSNILPPELSCEVDCEKLPLSPDAHAIARQSKLSPIDHALNDGEDFELLFALAPDSDTDSFSREWKEAFDTTVTKIGYAIESDDSHSTLILKNAPPEITATGYEHIR